MANRDSLRTELKLLRDDVHRITLELKERALKVEKLQNKFETISSKHHASADDEGEPKSQVRGAATWRHDRVSSGPLRQRVDP